MAESQVATLDTQLSEIDKRLQRLYDALETRKLILDDLAPRIKELRGTGFSGASQVRGT